MSLSILILQSLQNEESLQSKLSEHTCDLQRARSCNPLQSISRWAPCNTEQYVHAVFKVLHESAWPPMSDNFDSFFFLQRSQPYSQLQTVRMSGTCLLLISTGLRATRNNTFMTSLKSCMTLNVWHFKPSAWVEPVLWWFQTGSAQHVTVRPWRLWSLAWPPMSDTLYYLLFNFLFEKCLTIKKIW